jgi:hypothetical protein
MEPERAPSVGALVRTSLVFTHTDDAERPFTATAVGVTMLVQVNDFPAEPLYSLFANGVHVTDLDDWPAAWTRPGLPKDLRDLAARTPRGAALVAATAPLSVAALHTWATTLCTTPAADSEAVLRALRFDGALVDVVGYRRLASPPAQTLHTDVGESGGELVTLRFKPRAAPITRGDLDTELGDGSEMVRIHGDAAHRIRYPIAVESAPFTCDVIASFHVRPTPDAAAYEIDLRRQRRI